MRYQYSFHKTRDKAEASLEDDFATGDIVMGEQPRIEPKKDHRGRILGYAVTLEDYS